MKKLYYYLLILTGFYANAQIINFPDPNLKFRLINVNCAYTVDSPSNLVDVDTNNDGEIQLTEALAVTHLSISNQGLAYNIPVVNDLSVLENFTNLKGLSIVNQSVTNINLNLPFLNQLSCYDSAVSSINFSLLPNLLGLSVWGNNNTITTLDLTMLTHLDDLSCRSSSVTNINVSGLQELTEIDITDSSIVNLDVSGLENLIHLYFTYTDDLVSINATGSNSLNYIDGENSKIQNLDFSGLTGLMELHLDYADELQSLNISNCTSLEELYFSNTDKLENLNVSGCASLKKIQAEGVYTPNVELNLDFSGLSNLKNVYLSGGSIYSINFSGCTALEALNCEGNFLTTLDISECPSLIHVYADYNPLQYLYLKNGHIDHIDYNQFDNMIDPHLYYICADEEEIYLYENNGDNTDDTVVNSYCSFTPGGTYNTINGSMHFDYNANGCDSNDRLMENITVNISGTAETDQTFTNKQGQYTYYMGIGTITLTPMFTNDYFSFSPASYEQVFTGTGETNTVNFCMVPNGAHPDLDIVLLPRTARPGFDTVYELVYQNKGNQIQSGTINFAYNDAVLDFITASTELSAQNENMLSWNFSGLAPFETRTITITLNLNSPVEDPAVNIDDILTFTAALITDLQDETPDDNTSLLEQVVVGSYDPNDKQISEGATITPGQAGKDLHYIVRFQNSGTAEAINVVVKDILANNLDWSTFKPLAASHPYRTTLTEGNKAEFFFENINLPAEQDNESGSHGYVSFSIKPKAGVAVGDVIENTAEIYFDYNAPIITNTVSTTIAILERQDFDFDNYLMLYPNPAKSKITVAVKNPLTIESINIYNMLGQMVLSCPVESQTNVSVDVSRLQKGNYLLEVVSDKGRTVQKIIKM